MDNNELAEKQTHTDHPMRHWDRTCPTCLTEQQEPVVLSDIEQYRMQMSLISTAAFGYWKDGDRIHTDYNTVALKDVVRLYKRYENLLHNQTDHKKTFNEMVELYEAQLDKQANRIAELEKTSKECDGSYGYAKRLAEVIWEKYYKQEKPRWEPLPTTLGVLTQIDNMTSGLRKSHKEWVGLTPDAALDLAEVMRPLLRIPEDWLLALSYARAIESKLKDHNT